MKLLIILFLLGLVVGRAAEGKWKNNDKKDDKKN